MGNVSEIRASSEGLYHLKLALEFAMVYHSAYDKDKHKLTHYAVHDGVLYFGWHESSGGAALPCAMGIDGIAPMITGWLAEQEYPREPDIDGHCSKGWTLFNQIPYQVPGHFYWTFGVRPNWQEYHK